ncbi:MAG: hypothetical protein M1831_006812 [Alyxoria varia]|nr:MAG: hypothetical protein M1831_006812 [Alyxoria varia]
MSEVQFAKQFLSTLDSRPVKLSSDHVLDARKLPAQPPFILPRNPKPFPSSTGLQASTQKPSSSEPAHSSGLTSITLVPLRRTATAPAPVTLPPLHASRTSVYDLKTKVAARTGYTTDKLKILWQKRPVGDSKTVAEVVFGSSAEEARKGEEVEMGVMYTGEPTNRPQAEEDLDGKGQGDTVMKDVEVETTRTAEESSTAPKGWDVLKSEGFWSDLQGFVEQKCGNGAIAKEAVEKWKSIP